MRLLGLVCMCHNSFVMCQVCLGILSVGMQNHPIAYKEWQENPNRSIHCPLLLDHIHYPQPGDPLPPLLNMLRVDKARRFDLPDDPKRFLEILYSVATSVLMCEMKVDRFIYETAAERDAVADQLILLHGQQG